MPAAAASVFLVDNYDSFTYNVAQQLGELGAAVEVCRNDAFDVDALAATPPDGIVISPGPGAPGDAGLSNEVIRRLAGRAPILGICLGHQCIGEVFGATVVRAPQPVHGKTSAIAHDGEGVFAGLPQPFDATRYHSLAVADESVGPDLKVTARTAPGSGRPAVVMGLRHRRMAVEGVQFHPESILTSAGPSLLANFLASLRTALPVA